MVNQYVWLRRSFKRARIEDSEEVHMTVHKLIEQVSVGKANLRQNQDLNRHSDVCIISQWPLHYTCSSKG